MIDTHCHLNFPELLADLDGVLARATAAGIDRFVVPATDFDSNTSGVNLSEIYPSIYACVGLHPCDAKEYSPEHKKKINRLLDTYKRIVSVGEVGLDYYHFDGVETEEERESIILQQKGMFRDMIALAGERGLPLIIHSRAAFHDTYEILAEKAQGIATVIHCFTGTAEEAKAWIDLGCYISLTGIITYKKNQALRDIVAKIPLERIMLETDAPFLAPEGFRGTTCEPQYVSQVAQCVAQIHGVAISEIKDVSTKTAEQFFAFNN